MEPQLRRIRKGAAKEFRRDAQIVFQDPGSSLNPYQDVRQILSLSFEGAQCCAEE